MAEKKTLLGYIAGAARDTLSIVTLGSAVLGAIYWLFEPHIVDWIKVNFQDTAGRPCVVIPLTGHYIEGARPGEWGTVEWRDVNRLRDDCGVPRVSGVIVNGGGFYHDAPLSLSGVPLPVGRQPVKYKFFINEGVKPGPSRFQVVVAFPEAVGGAPVALSPWLSFPILKPTEGQ